MSGIEEFTLQYKAQQEWGWLANLDFFLAGGGAGLFLIGLAFGIGIALPIGLAAAALGALTLLIDLGQPQRSWTAITRPGTSWISRGAILVALFLVFGVISTALPPISDDGLRITIEAIAAIAAVGVMAYTGFLLAASPGIPAWHGALVPVQFVVLSLLTGCGGLYLIVPLHGGATISFRALELVGVGLGLGALLMLVAYLVALRSSASGARQAEHELVQGRLVLHFLGGGVLMGLVVPLAILVYLFLSELPLAHVATLLAAAGVLLIVGVLLTRYSLLKVGFYQPIVEHLGTY